MGISISRIQKSETEKQVEKWARALDRLWREGKGKSEEAIELETLLDNYWEGFMDEEDDPNHREEEWEFGESEGDDWDFYEAA